MENKTMIRLVVGTEAIFFLCLIMAFVYMAYHAGFEPHQRSSLDIRTTGAYTVLLLGSSLTLMLAERGYRKGSPRGLKGWLLTTLVLGGLFLFGQGREYLRLIHKNITLSGSVFGTSFFTLTGFHGLHVLIGLIVLGIILLLAFLGDYDRPKKGGGALGTAAVYWHFVDIVWIVVFIVVYLLPKI
ncbi:MAG TPA: cytochrome c oxidase subunit 3 [Puia sp.]|jgi:heme/copper-type cytochrome/quinol oxidase subunit 3